MKILIAEMGLEAKISCEFFSFHQKDFLFPPFLPSSYCFFYFLSFLFLLSIYLRCNSFKVPPGLVVNLMEFYFQHGLIGQDFTTSLKHMM
uniref:Uncharacterized protein n=1 Tax=Rhizophora mucronata TaxID=61149 RepID=A0A2P2K4T1_RHIMU